MKAPPSRARVRRALTTWVVGSALGVGVIAVPDDDRAFSLSETHGPGVLDLVGIVVLTAAWVPVAAVLWAGRAVLATRGGAVVAVLFVLGGALLAVTIAADLGAWYLLGVAVLVVAQLVALRLVAGRAEGPRADAG